MSWDGGRKPLAMSLSISEKLSLHVGCPLELNDATSSRSVVRALHCLTLTRPNIAFSVNKVDQIMHAFTAIY